MALVAARRCKKLHCHPSQMECASQRKLVKKPQIVCEPTLASHEFKTCTVNPIEKTKINNKQNQKNAKPKIDGSSYVLGTGGKCTTSLKKMLEVSA